MTIQEKYNKYLNGELSRDTLIYEIRRDPHLKSHISSVMSFDDSIKVLKQRGIINEAQKKIETLTLDTANPYEYKKGLDYELGLCYSATPNISEEEFTKVQKKVLSNLAKDANFYTKTLANVKVGKEDKAAAQVEVKPGDKVTDKLNASKNVGKKVKANVKDTLNKKEKAKSKTAGVKVMGIAPKKVKGVKVMAMPGKEKKIKIKENIDQKLNELLGFGKDHLKNTSPRRPEIGSFAPTKGPKEKDPRPVVSLGKNKDDRKKYGDDPHHFIENIPAANTNVLPFAKIQAGMRASDDSGETFKILAVGDYNKLKRYDVSKSFDKFLSSDPSGIDANQLVALIDQEGNTFVRVYGTGGVYVYDNDNVSKEAIVVKPNTPDADPMKLKKYTDKGLDIKLDPNLKSDITMRENMKLSNILKELDLNEPNVPTKVIPDDEKEKAEVKAAIMPTIMKAYLEKNIDLNKDIAIKDGRIWIRVSLGYGVLSKEQLETLCSDKKFLGVNPVTNTVISLIFSK